MKIGFIGLGAMGRPMAANLVKAGHDLVVRDVDAATADAFVAEHGGTIARQADDFASVHAVITMLPTGAIVREALLGLGGAAAGLPAGTLVIDMSSSEPDGTRQLGADLAEKGLSFIDAPVSGGVGGAVAGKLTIMIGGEGEPVQRARPILEALGSRLFETGGLGSGHAMKALNNYVSAAAFGATAEAMLIGEKFGLDPSTAIDILNVSTGRTFHSEIAMKDQVIGGRFNTGFALALAAKDVRIAAEMADSAAIDTPLVRFTADRMTAASEELGPKADVTEAIKAWGKPR